MSRILEDEIMDDIKNIFDGYNKSRREFISAMPGLVQEDVGELLRSLRKLIIGVSEDFDVGVSQIRHLEKYLDRVQIHFSPIVFGEERDMGEWYQ